MWLRKKSGRASYLWAYTAPAVLLLGVALVLGAGGLKKTRDYPDPVPLQMAGLLGNGEVTYLVPPDIAPGSEYLPGSSVLRLPDGDLRYLPPGATEPVTVPPGSSGAGRAVAGDRAWLKQGEVPGTTREERRMAERALLDLRLLTGPDGATVAAPYKRWNYVWPRDASWAAVAFAATGHHEESYEILEFIASVQKEDGTWEARYNADGSPILDGRAAQLDATGWFPWAVWFYANTAPDGDRGTETLQPAVRRAADAAAASLNSNGLPPGGPDYWEIKTWKPNLGTAAPLRTGLRASAGLARDTGHDAEARRYAYAADRLDSAISREFAPNGYPRTTGARSGADAAVTFLAPPFAAPDPAVEKAVAETAEKLRAPNGGLLPGEKWRQKPTVAWTPETALFALSAAASGDEAEAGRYLQWLADHRTDLGSLPEKVDGAGEPQAVAPLGWTSAVVVLTLAAEEEPLPIPPR